MELKPCPFCGYSNTIVKIHILSRRLPWWYLECDNCHWRSKTKLLKKRAVKAWNRRANDD